MKQVQKLFIFLIAGTAMVITGCDKDNDMDGGDFDTSGTYMQQDQTGRPGIATVFIGADRKDEFNRVTPMNMGAAFKTDIANKLTAFGFTQNSLGQTKDQFASLLATDVLNVKLNGTTTFFDGTNVLTGRTLADDVIDTELLLIFGGPMGTANPGLTKDNVNANDKVFLNSFPFLATPH